MRFALTGSRVFDGDTIRTGVAVLVEDTRIAAIVEESELDGEVPRRRLDGGLLAPGFIDVQVNGGGGTLFNATHPPKASRAWPRPIAASARLACCRPSLPIGRRS